MAQIVARKRTDGGRSFQVRWRLGGARGGAWQSETFRSRDRAEAFRLDVEEANHSWPRGWIKGEGYVRRSADAKTLANVVQDYLALQDRRVALGRVKAYTVYRYRRNCELHLLPTLGDIPFSYITDAEVSDWVDALLEAGLAPKTIHNYHGTLFSVMAHGQKRMHLRSDNPCEISELPQADAREARQIRFFQHEEWALLRACLKADVQLLVDVLLATGMRWGEVSALRVGDVALGDPDVVSLRVVRAWSRRAPDETSLILEDQGESSKWRLGPPKNKRSRYVVITGDTARELRAAIGASAAGEYIFRTRYGNPWRYSEFHSDRWRPAVVDAMKRGLDKPATPHMLRHTTVVWGLAEGVPIQVISEMLGHASIQITYDVYGGLIDVRDPALAQAMARAMTTVKAAIAPAPSREEVEARSLRPGKRGETRKRSGPQDAAN